MMTTVSTWGWQSRHKPVIHKIGLNNLRSLKSHGGVDRALLSFDLHADLRPAFHWNIKQLFVAVVATYKTNTNVMNEVVLWDRIVEASDGVDARVVKEKNVFVKYALIDQGAELRGKEVELKLIWDHMPLTGMLYMGQDKEVIGTFNLPDTYQ